MKVKLQSVFNVTNKINQYLRQIYERLHNTAIMLKSFPLGQIIQMQKPIKINNKIYKEKYSKLLKYLKHN